MLRCSEKSTDIVIRSITLNNQKCSLLNSYSALYDFSLPEAASAVVSGLCLLPRCWYFCTMTTDNGEIYVESVLFISEHMNVSLYLRVIHTGCTRVYICQAAHWRNTWWSLLTYFHVSDNFPNTEPRSCLRQVTKNRVLLGGRTKPQKPGRFRHPGSVDELPHWKEKSVTGPWELKTKQRLAYVTESALKHTVYVYDSPLLSCRWILDSLSEVSGYIPHPSQVSPVVRLPLSGAHGSRVCVPTCHPAPPAA